MVNRTVLQQTSRVFCTTGGSLQKTPYRPMGMPHELGLYLGVLIAPTRGRNRYRDVTGFAARAPVLITLMGARHVAGSAAQGGVFPRRLEPPPAGTGPQAARPAGGWAMGRCGGA
jgi:hypothetical protein